MSLRREIEACTTKTDRGDVRGFPRLRSLAAWALAGVAEPPDGYEPGDLVGEYLLDVAEQGPDSVHDLLAFDDSALRGAVRNRLRQLAVEAGPHADIYRGLLRLVKRSLENGLPAAPAAKPLALATGSARKLSPKRALPWSYERKAMTTVRKMLKEGGISDGTMRYALEELAGYRERSDR